jgi:hypothetical protein
MPIRVNSKFILTLFLIFLQFITPVIPYYTNAAGKIDLIRDLDPGSDGGTGEAVQMGNYVYFKGYNTDTGYELFRTDGTESGQDKLKKPKPVETKNSNNIPSNNQITETNDSIDSQEIDIEVVEEQD